MGRGKRSPIEVDWIFIFVFGGGTLFGYGVSPIIDKVLKALLGISA
jgi:hypothetical protein